MEVALPDGFGADAEGLAECPGTRRGGELAARWADVREADPLGHVEGRAVAAGEGARHELCPDGEGRLRTGQAERLVLVVADPDDRQEVGREAGEPGVAQVVRGAGLAGRVERKPGGA